MNHDCWLLIVPVIEVTTHLQCLRACTQFVGNNTPGALGWYTLPLFRPFAALCLSFPLASGLQRVPASFRWSCPWTSISDPLPPGGNSRQLSCEEDVRDGCGFHHWGPISCVSRRGAGCRQTQCAARGFHAILQTTAELPACAGCWGCSYNSHALGPPRRTQGCPALSWGSEVTSRKITTEDPCDCVTGGNSFQSRRPAPQGSWRRSLTSPIRTEQKSRASCSWIPSPKPAKVVLW